MRILLILTLLLIGCVPVEVGAPAVEDPSVPLAQPVEVGMPTETEKLKTEIDTLKAQVKELTDNVTKLMPKPARPLPEVFLVETFSISPSIIGDNLTLSFEYYKQDGSIIRSKNVSGSLEITAFWLEEIEGTTRKREQITYHTSFDMLDTDMLFSLPIAELGQATTLRVELSSWIPKRVGLYTNTLDLGAILGH